MLSTVHVHVCNGTKGMRRGKEGWRKGGGEGREKQGRKGGREGGKDLPGQEF